jgi:hypothetical protein
VVDAHPTVDTRPRAGGPSSLRGCRQVRR